jgi:Flp pilus assembly protein TadD
MFLVLGDWVNRPYRILISHSMFGVRSWKREKFEVRRLNEAVYSGLPMKRAWVYPLLILTAIVVTYANSFSGPFIFDDLPWIEANPHVRHLWPLWNTLQPPHGAAGTGRPMVCLTLGINYAVSGLEPWSYHVFNLAIHACAALVLFGIVRRTLQGPRLRDRFGAQANGLAAAVAVCWAIHPLQTESVTYIIQRMESLMGFFLLLTLYCVIRGHDSPRRSWWYATAIICCALGMGTKEGMIIAPIIVLLYDCIFLAASWAELWHKRSALYAGLAATPLILIALVGMNKSRGGGLLGSPAVSWWRYAQNQFGAIAHYMRLTFWPDRLCLDYGWQASPLPRSWIAVGAMLAVWVVAATGWALANAAPLGFLGAWFLLTLAPSSSVVPIQDMMAERRMYLPLAAVVSFIAIAGWIAVTSLSHRFRWTGAARASACLVLTALVVGALAWRTAERNHNYRSGIAIWTDTIHQRPLNGRAWNNLGYSYYKARQVDWAVACLRRAIELLPTHAPTRAMAYDNLGNVHIAQGRYNEAITDFSEALRLNPNNVDAHNDLGCALQQLGERDKALEHFRTAIRIQADHALAHYNMSVLLTDAGAFDEALRELQTARRLLPNRPEILFKLGVLLTNRGRYSEACANFAEALRLKPDFEQAREYLRLCEKKRRASDSQ